MSWIQTRHGIAFDLLAPTPEQVSLRDIAYSLARICRFTGHVPFYSVAQHSVLLSHQVPVYDAAVGLLHDAAEAYVGDVAAPLKGLIGGYHQIEERVRLVICERFRRAEGVHRWWTSDRLPEQVKHADLRMLATEKRDLMPGEPPRAWLPLPEPYPSIIEPWATDFAEAAFLARAQDLGIE